MKAFVHEIINGRERLGTMTNFVSNEYMNLRNLIKYALRNKTGTFHIEAFRDWGNRYGKADIDVTVTIYLFDGKRIFLAA